LRPRAGAGTADFQLINFLLKPLSALGSICFSFDSRVTVISAAKPYKMALSMKS